MFNNRIKVMIAEDNKNYAEFLSCCLSNYPEIELSGIAYNGKQVLKGIKELNPDVLLLDIVMPYMNGLEILKVLKDDNSLKPYIIVLSALSNPTITKQAVELGAKYILLKPVDTKTILNRIRSVMQCSDSIC